MATSKTISATPSVQSPEQVTPSSSSEPSQVDGKWHPSVSPECAGLDYLEPVSLAAARTIGRAWKHGFYKISYAGLGESGERDLWSLTSDDLQATTRNAQILKQKAAGLRLLNPKNQSEFESLHATLTRTPKQMEMYLHMAELELAFPKAAKERFYTFSFFHEYALVVAVVEDLSEICGFPEQAHAMTDYLELLESLTSEELAPEDWHFFKKPTLPQSEIDFLSECKKVLASAEKKLALAMKCLDEAEEREKRVAQSSLQAEVNWILSPSKREEWEWEELVTQAVIDAENSPSTREDFPLVLGEALSRDHKAWNRITRLYNGEPINFPGDDHFLQQMVGFGVTVGIMVASRHGIRIDPSLPMPEAKEASGVKA